MLSRCAENKDDSFHQDEILFNFVSKDFNFIILLSLNRRDVEKFSRLSFITHPTEITSEHNENVDHSIMSRPKLYITFKQDQRLSMQQITTHYTILLPLRVDLKFKNVHRNYRSLYREKKLQNTLRNLSPLLPYPGHSTLVGNKINWTEDARSYLLSTSYPVHQLFQDPL